MRQLIVMVAIKSRGQNTRFQDEKHIVYTKNSSEGSVIIAKRCESNRYEVQVACTTKTQKVLDDGNVVLIDANSDICMCGVSTLSGNREICGLWIKKDANDSYKYERSVPRDVDGLCSVNYCKNNFPELRNKDRCGKVNYSSGM